MDEIIGVIILIASVIVGGFAVVFLQNINRGNIIKLLLSLSGGFLIAIAFIHLIPELYIHNGVEIGYYILLGFLIQLFLEYFSQGIEHGHMHTNKGTIPWTLFLSLSIHAIIEGIPLEAQFHLNDAVNGINDLACDHSHTETHAHHHHHVHSHGATPNGLLLAIVLHNIPLSIALMTMMLSSGFSKTKSWLILIAFSLMGPLGVMLGHYGAANYLIDLEKLLAVVVGMFLHISTTIIFESSENHKFNIYKLLSLIAGVVLAMFAV